jgi:POT family proton-dependent oligopeptide transporter
MTIEHESVTPTTPTPTADHPPRKGFFGHPAGLVPLFSIELWERFSFYGLQVILAYYLYFSVTAGGLGVAQSTALAITGSYGGLVYISQMLGAWIADRLLAPKRLVLISALFIALGHLALATIAALPGLVTGLGLIVLGTGGLKVNVTSMVGHLYPKEAVRRDAGFALYYMGISFGAFLGPLVTGPLQTGIGFHAAFAAAAFAILIGLAVYLFRGKTLARQSAEVPNPLTGSGRWKALLVAIGVVVIVVATIATGVVNLDDIGQVVTALVVVASVSYFAVLLTSGEITLEEKRNVRHYIPIFIATLVFWTLLLQLFTTFAVYSDSRVNLLIGSVTLPAAYVVTAEGVFATLVAPGIAAVWTVLGRRQPATTHKIAIGLLVLAAGYLLFAGLSTVTGAVNIWPVLLGMLIFGVAEVTIAPAAMSVATKLAPRQFGAQMMSLYFLTMAGGSTLAGLLAGLYRPTNEAAFFGTIAVATVLVTGIYAAIVRRQRVTA